VSVTEFTYNNKKICNQCIYLQLDEGSIWEGTCICKTNKVKQRERHVTDKACSYKKVS
jgi:hypothetical protein